MKPTPIEAYTASQIIDMIRDNFDDEERIILTRQYAEIPWKQSNKPYETGFIVHLAVEVIHRLKEDIGSNNKWFIHLGKSIER